VNRVKTEMVVNEFQQTLDIDPQHLASWGVFRTKDPFVRF
jgi:hypothetical protein